MDHMALLSHTGLTAADVELVYEPSKDKLLALAAQQRHQNAKTPTLTSHNLLVITLHWLRKKPATTSWLASTPTRALLARHAAASIAVLGECIFSLFVPPLALDAPTSVFFANVKIIVDTTFVPLPKYTFVPKTTIRRVRRSQRGLYEVQCDRP